MSQRQSKAKSDEELNQLSKDQLVEIIKALPEEIAGLKQSLKLDSKTSSTPLAGDLSKKSEKKKYATPSDEEETKRKPGGQPGHEGKTRKGFGRVDRIKIWRPQVCHWCGGTDFWGEETNIEVQQVAQLVAKQIEIVEYHLCSGQCANCKVKVSAPWPDEIIESQDLGVRLQAFIGWLGNYGHMPYAKISELLYELGEIDMGEGTLVATNQRVATSVKTPFKQLGEWVKTEQPNVHVDETPWAVKGVKEWLWVVASKRFCLFPAADTRSGTELEQILGCSYRGVLSSDDFSVDNGYDVGAQQKCLAHIRRHFWRLIQTPGRHNGQIGNVFVDLIDDAFARYHDFQLSCDWKQYVDGATRLKLKLKKAILKWIPHAGATALNLLSKLRPQYDCW